MAGYHGPEYPGPEERTVKHTRTGVIRNAALYDGTGAPPRQADVAIVGDRIAGIEAAGAGDGSTLLDASGLCLCPGFIDIHSHSDMALAHPRVDELLEPFLAQGLTTQVIGNCGLGVAPAPSASRDGLAAFMALIIPDGTEFRWESFAEYLDYLESNGPPLNVVPLAAHGALRNAVLGAAPGPARGDDLAAIGALLRDCLAAGAFGLSAGLIYPPGMWADTEELVELARTVAIHDGLFACHVRGSSELAIEATRELIEIGRRAGVRVQHSHHEAFGPGYWHLARETMAMERQARAQGIDIASDVIPYHAVNTTLLAVFPPWALAGGVDALCRRLRGPEAAKIERDIGRTVPAWPPWDDGWAHNLVRAGGWDNIVILQAGSAAHGGWIGRNLQQIADDEARTPFACAADLIVASRGNVMARYHAISGAPGEDGVLRDLLTEQTHAVGVDVILKGEGVSHPGGYGAVPRLLGHYARERGWLGLAEAIRKVTALPAERLGLGDRGRIVPGAAADLVLFDAERIGEAGSYGHPDRPPHGISRVLVNGRIAIADGRLEDGRAGAVLRRGA
jgi:N-acyl-D-aspartate/D-glutamate deacylase